jgi:DNA segregation ATPase FtsK/SpoIIIE-like protein
MGVVGAYVADLFVQLLGVVSFFIVALIALVGFNFLVLRSSRHSVYTKILAFIILTVSCCALLSKLFYGKNCWEYETWGGALGYYINNVTISIPARALMVVYTLLLVVSLYLLLDFSPKFSQRATKNICRVIVNTPGFVLRVSYGLFRRLFLKSVPEKPKRIRELNSRSQINTMDLESEKSGSMPEAIGEEMKNSRRREASDLALEAEKRKKSKTAMFSFLAGGKKSTIGDNYRLPILELLNSPSDGIVSLTKEELRLQAANLLRVLREYKITGKIVSIKVGPIITLHEFEPSAGTKSSRIIGCADDIARNLKVESARISVIAEKNVVGIELPNRQRNTIFLRDILELDEYRASSCALPVVLGSDIAGTPVVMDLARAPHLLIAGTTGSGKSVCINAMILSLLYKFHPGECKMIKIDPKRLELSAYDGIPHLLMPVVTDSKKAVTSMKWIVNEMENRYRVMSGLGVRNIYGYNEKVRQALRDNIPLESRMLVGYDERGEPIYTKRELEMKQLPFIVVIVDEMADLMITAGKEIEALIQRIAQMARAAGIHIIMATQRPSVDVITGVIKANFPSRISFLVSSRIDSKVILGEQGAEQLLGMGDMLYMQNGSKISRAHGPFVSDVEVEKVVEFIVRQGFKPEYVKMTRDNDSLADDDNDEEGGNFDINIVGQRDDEALYHQAVDIIKRDKKVSVSYLQRQLRVGYNKAATLIERMEREGIISPMNTVGKRDILE